MTKATTSFPLELRRKDFIVKTETLSRKRKGKREYLNGGQTRHLMKQLNAFFEVTVEVPRIRIGGRQTIETLINEEALLFAKYLRNEKKDWMPRIGTTNQNRTWELQLDRARKGDSVSLRN